MHADCILSRIDIFSDPSCTVPWIDPKVTKLTSFCKPNYPQFCRFVIDIHNPFPFITVYYRGETRGLVTACSDPHDIEVCGHETVSLLSNPSLPVEFHYELSTVPGTVQKPIVVSTLFTVDSKYCLITNYEIHYNPSPSYSMLYPFSDVSVEAVTNWLVI